MSSSESSSCDTQKSGRASGWLLTGLLVVAIIGGAIWWRSVRSRVYVPRTRALILQKTGSLEAYNNPVPEKELLQSLAHQLGSRPVRPEAYAAMAELVTGKLLPTVWHESQQLSPDERFISLRAMHATIHKLFPQRLLPNGDVILFPDDRDLRIVVSEPPQDFFRDTGWHWRWMGLYLNGLSAEQCSELKELDIYAAEELSEFLSVLSVALVELADRSDQRSTAPIDGQAIKSIYAQILQRRGSTQETGASPSSLVAFSTLTKQRVVASIPKPMFQEVTAKLKLDFQHRPNTELRSRRADLEVPLGIAGGGVASEDFNGDGHLDLYFAGDEGGRLYRNVSGEHFEDVTELAGLKLEGESRAGYFIDYDNDGDLDLFITFVWQSNRLYQNDGSGSFSDVTRESGLHGGKEITHEAVWFDMNNDGLLDLYTANFGLWAEGAVPTLGRFNNNAGPNRLYRQRLVNGKQVFEEIGHELSVDDRGWTHCVGAWDFDQDGFMDLFSLNDFGSSIVYRNINGERFVGASRDLHLDATYNAMNFTLLDIDHTGRPAIYVSQIMKLMHRQRYRKPTEKTEIVFSAENLQNLRALVTNRLYRMHHDSVYEDVHDTRLEPADLGWAWDASAFDYENDGDLDLLVLNGTESSIPRLKDEYREGHLGGRVFLAQYANEKNVCFFSEEGYFYDVSKHCPMAYEGNSRGSTFFDFDGDGDLDVAINNYNAPARIFENLQHSDHAWIRFKLEGTRSNRSAVGARVEIRIGDQRRFDQVVSGSGFLSQNPMTLHFGLGTARQVDKVIITWPSGAIQELADLPVNQTHQIRESTAK